MSNPFVLGLIKNNQELFKRYSSIIALAIRNEIEDFHVKHLTDAQMKELNPLIRNAVYNTLFILANFEKNERCAKILDLLIKMIPSYWEAPELNEDLKKVHDEIMNKTVTFKSAFLNQQLKLGNISYLPPLAIIRLSFSHDFKGIEYDDRKKHKDKIINELKKEEYEYDHILDGYKIPLWK